MALGSGPSLDEDFDFSIHPTGDLNISGGRKELNKDLSFQLTFSLKKYLGSTPTTNVEAEATDTAIKVIEADQRVRTVLQGRTSATLSEDSRELTVDATFITIDGEEYEYVYTI